MSTNTHNAVSIAIKVQLARIDQGQAWLAEQTGISRSTLWRKMTGDSPFDLNECAAIAKAFGMTLAELVAMADAEAARVA